MCINYSLLMEYFETSEMLVILYCCLTCLNIPDRSTVLRHICVASDCKKQDNICLSTVSGSDNLYNMKDGT